jgi:DNA-binding SARP family transcriptional activator
MLRVRLLGGLAFERDGREVAPPASRRARLLAGWLALHPGLHGREALAARLRPDVLDDSARQSLRQAAWQLRAAVGDDLVATRDALGFGPDVSTDVAAFAAAVSAGDVETALGLCGGELLAGVEDDWVLAERDRHARALDELLAAAAARATAPEDVLALARRRADLDPLGEEAHRALMRALAEAGDRAAALAVFERLRDRLARELRTAPSAATRELAAALREPAGQALPVPRGQAAARLRTRATSPLVGRDEALAALEAAWVRARAGMRGVVLVTGPPGIGKTRIAAELAARVQAGGGAALAGRCTQEGHLPYAPFAEALGALAADGGAALASAIGAQAADLGRLVPTLPAPPHGEREGDRHRLFAAADAALVAAAGPAGLLLVIDDLHWADAPTLGLLTHVVSDPGPAPLLVVALLRPAESRAAPALGAALGALRRHPDVVDLRLEGLEPPAAARLAALAGAGAHAAAIGTRAGGNPLLVEELARSGVAPGEVPPGVRDLVAERVARLGPEVAAALALAAVQGAEFDLATVERAAGEDVLDALEAAVADGLLAEAAGRPGGFAFSHALVRDAVESSLGTARRARLHGRIAEALDPGAHAELAHHWRAAAGVVPEAGARAVAAARAAAGDALTALAFEEAARHLAAALEGPVAPTERLELLLGLGDARARSGARSAANAAFEEAHALALSLGDAASAAEAALGLGGVGVTLLTVDDGLVARLEDALTRLPEAETRTRARVLGRLGVELYYADDGRRARGETCSADAVALARAVGDPRALGAALHARRIALWRADRLDERLATTEELIALGTREGLTELEVQGRHWRFVDLLEAGDVGAADAELERYADATARLGLPAWSWYVPLWRACRAAMAGRYAEAEALGREAAAIGARAGDANAGRDVWMQRTAMLFEQERFDELDEASALAALEASARPGAWHSGIAWVFAARGDPRAAAHLDALAAGGWALLPHDANHLACLSEAAEAAAYLGDAARGRDVLAMLAPYTDRNVLNARAVNAYGSGAFAAGRAATAAGDRELAARHLARAVEHNRALGAWPRAELAERRLRELDG